MVFFLIRPFTNVSGRMNSYHPPLNLATLAAYLEMKGIDVKLYDYCENPYDTATLLDNIKKYSPTAIGLSSYTNTIIPSHEIAKEVKKHFPDIPIIIGGPHSTAMPKETLLEFPCFDFIVVGEGEETLHDLLTRLSKKEEVRGTKGIAHRSGEEIIIEPYRELISDLDSIPFPNRRLIQCDKSDRHFSRGLLLNYREITSISTSRGCHFDCIFCAVNRSYSNSSKAVRYRSVANVTQEIEKCVNEFEIKHINFFDDSFALKESRLFPIAEKLKQLNLTWNCDIRASSAKRDALEHMKKCGCIKLSIGVESGSQRIMDLLNKKITVDQVKKAFKMCHEVGFKIIEGTFIVGSHPDETMDDVNKSISLIKEIKPDLISVAIGTPYPGTKLRTIMASRGLIESNDWYKYSLIGKPLWRTEHFSPDDLVKLQKRLMRKFYLNLHVFFYLLKTPKYFFHMLRAGLQFFFQHH